MDDITIPLELTVPELLALWAALEDFISPNIEKEMTKTGSEELYAHYLGARTRVYRLAAHVNEAILKTYGEKDGSEKQN